MQIRDMIDQALSTEEQDTQKRLALLIAERRKRAVQTQEAILGAVGAKKSRESLVTSLGNSNSSSQAILSVSVPGATGKRVGLRSQRLGVRASRGALCGKGLVRNFWLGRNLSHGIKHHEWENGKTIHDVFTHPTPPVCQMSSPQCARKWANTTSVASPTPMSPVESTRSAWGGTS